MTYKLWVSDLVGEEIDKCLHYIRRTLKNEQAAKSITKDIWEVIDILENMPKSFPCCNDSVLKAKGLRKAILRNHQYLFIFRIDDERQTVFVEGFYHERENYKSKLKI